MLKAGGHLLFGELVETKTYCPVHHHPLLSTPRLTIRPFLLDDDVQVFRLNADSHVMQHLPKDEVYATLFQARFFLERYQELMKETPFGRQAVIRKSDGAWLGWCGLKALGDGTVDLGFRFHREYWGNGYATESGKAWLAYGFGEGNLKRIIGNAASGNIGSQRALEKIGLHRCPAEDFSEDGFDWLRYVIMG
jgi:RimJ/RimL family protein N-acetyltransferase